MRRRLQNRLYDNEVSSDKHIITANLTGTTEKLSLIDDTLFLPNCRGKYGLL